MSARDLFWRHGSAPAALEATPTSSEDLDASPDFEFATLAASAADPAAGPNVKALFSSPSEGRSKPAPAKKRLGKRLSQGYIPRPQNPFMLFRANFIKQKHIPGSVETNQSLSKIIGIKWRSLTPEEKNVWEIKAEHEKAAHKIRFPEYRFRPIHNKGRKSQAATFDDDAGKKGNKRGDQRSDEAGACLLEGARAWEMQSMAIQHHPSYTGMVTRHRRSSSAPQPSGRFEYPKNRVITLPTLPAIISRPSSPSSVPSISRFRQSHKSLLNAPQHHAHDQLVCSPPDLAHLYGSPLLQAIVHSGQSMSQSFTPAAYGADQTNLGLGEHRRSLSSQSQDYSFLAPSSWTMPTMEQNGFIPMSASTTSFTPTLFDSNMAQANVEEDQSLPEVDLEFFSDFPFNEDIYDLNPEDQNYSPESENPSASASPSPLLNDQCIDGTINPAALRLPAFSGLTPIDTSVHALSRSSSLESEPFSSISSQSTPMMTPSSSFPSSPAPSPSSSISSSDDVDVDFSNLFNVECFDASYSYDAAFSSPPALYEDDGTFGYGFEADNATISSTWPFEEGSIGSKMMDMTTPTQAMFGMEST